MDEQWFVLTKDTLRKALQITPINNNQAFIAPLSSNVLVDFVNQLGYPKLVRNVSNVVTNDMFQPWRALITIINLCLTGKTYRRHKFYPRLDSSLHLPNGEPVLGYLKFSAKRTKREVFGMPIPGSLITTDIREASYYQEYLANVANHRRYLADKIGSVQDSPVPEPTKPARKPKVPKAPPRPPVSTPVTSAQPTPTSAPTKPQEKKRKQATDTSDKPAKAKKFKYSVVSKVTAEDANLQKALEESMKIIYSVSRGLLPPVVAHELLSLQKAKKKSLIDQYIFQRCTFTTTGSSRHTEPIYAKLERSEREKTEKVVPQTDEVGKGKNQAGSNTDETSEGQARPDPSYAGGEVQSILSYVVYAGSDREHIDLAAAEVPPQPSQEQLDEGFTATVYPKVQENFKLAVEEQVLLEDPASLSGVLSSLQHLSKDIGFGDLFFSDKPLEADNDKTTAETKVESMVSVMIQQDMSTLPPLMWTIPPMMSPIIDLTLRPESPKVQHQFKATTTKTTTTITTTLPPPTAQQQSITEAMMMKRIGELKHIMANLIKVNKGIVERLDTHGARLYKLEQLDIPQQVSKVVKADMKEILHQCMWETESHKSHKDHMQLFKALENSMNHDHSEELAQDIAEARKKRKKSRESPKMLPSSPPHQPHPPSLPTGPSISLTPADLEMDEDMALDEQVQSSDDEDIGSAHILKASALASNYSPPPKDSLLAQTGDIAKFMDWFCKRRGISELKPQDLEGSAFEIIKVFHPDVIHLQYQMEECQKLLTDSVDDPILRHNVSKLLPLGGPPVDIEKVVVCSSLQSLKPKRTIESRAKRSSKIISLGHYSIIIASSHTVKMKMEILLEPTSNKLLVANELTNAYGKAFEVLNNVLEHRNKPDFDTMSFDDLYNNFKIVKQEPEFKGYGPKTSKSVSQDISNEVKESPDTPLIEEFVSDDNYKVLTARRTSHCQRRKMPPLEEKRSHCQKDRTAINDKKKLQSKMAVTLRESLSIHITLSFHTHQEMDQQYLTVAKIPILDTGKFEQWQFKIQQYLQHEHYALWEVIEFRDSYVVPADTTTTNTTSGEKSGRTVTLTTEDMQRKKNNVKARTTLLLSLHDDHQLRFIKHSSRHEDGNTACVPSASTNVPTASASVATISQDTACAYIASQSSGSQIKFEDIKQIDEDNVEEMDIKWNMALLSMRSYMANEEEDHASVADEVVPTEFALMANTSAESKEHSYANRPVHRTLAVRSPYRAPWVPTINRNYPPVNRKFSTCSKNFPTANRKFPTASRKFPTASTKSSTADMGMKGKAIKPSACWFWKPSHNPFNKGPKNNSVLVMFKKYTYIDTQGRLKMYSVGKRLKFLDDAIIYLRTPRQHNMYSIDLNNIFPHRDLTYLVAKESADEWKQHKASCKSKLVNSITKPLHTLHMDLFGPTSDETSGILKKFITEIENLKDLKVKIIRCDNRGEFRNKEMNDFCSQKGIKREFSNARNPQQNGVAERRNRTLIKAAKTMLADAKLPVTFWAEPVNTACYIQNRVLVNKSHNKTPYELFNGISPALGFLKPFGCHVMILNNFDHLGKFKEKGDEGYFIGYLMSSKAFRAHDALLEFSSSKPQDHCSTEVPEGSGNTNPTVFTLNLLVDHMETLTVETPIPTDPEYPAKVYKLEKAMYGFHRLLEPVLQKEDGIFLSQDKYVGDILKKFGYLDVRSSNTPMDKDNPWGKDGTEKDGHPKLGLWYPKDSPFDLVAYSDSDYSGATQDCKSTTRGCQFLGRRLISWQCKKQTIVAISTTEAEYVAAASCCG
uniref:Integrase catalytic domain-containing protein n=1 Tax=Tanacetum cinerariifolium TaxID=118510 RepID=A0A699GQW8_TANCI|nr:hypothetical protein [Tanacetum cinerariifolium]